MGADLPSVPAVPAVVIEVVLTFLLMFIILGVSGNRIPERPCAARRRPVWRWAGSWRSPSGSRVRPAPPR
jgi:glycerol uptake facilitator-like aquaporin